MPLRHSLNGGGIKTLQHDVPGPTIITGRASSQGKLMVPFFTHSGTVGRLLESSDANQVEHTPRRGA